MAHDIVTDREFYTKRAEIHRYTRLSKLQENVLLIS